MNDDVINALGSILSNPDTMSKIGNIISKHTGSEIRDSSPQSRSFSGDSVQDSNGIGEFVNKSEKLSPTHKSEEINESAPDFSSKSDEEQVNFHDQIALLLAIKPYLSPKRRNTIDTFIRFTKMGNLFKNFL